MNNTKSIFLKFIILIGGLFIINNLKAQSYEVLKNKWRHAKSDTARVNAGLKLFTQYYYQPTDSIPAANKLIIAIYNLALKTDYADGIIEGSYRLGENYINLGIPKLAIEYFYISFKKSEKTKNEGAIARSKMGIGLVYYNQNNWLKAIDFFKGSLAINKKIKEKGRVATQHYLIGLCLNSLDRFEEAKLYIDSALKIKLELKDTGGINECMLGLAQTHKGRKQYDSALKYYNQLLPVFISKKEPIPCSIIYSSLAEIELSHNRITDAEINANKAYQYALTSTDPIAKLMACEILYKINFAKKDYKNALHFNNLYIILKDSMGNSNLVSQLSVAQTTYDFEKKQAVLKAEQDKKELRYNLEIKSKNRKQSILTFIAILSLLFVISIVFAYRWVSRQKKISENLLLNILPKETTQELKKFGKALSKNHDQVSIMFCDIKNFSHIAETLPPESVVEMLDTYFKQFDIISEKYGVEKIKTIGDAYMCVGGLIKNESNAAKNTLQTAIEFLKFNTLIEEDMMKKYQHAFSFRIGIHTGNVVSGVVGLRKYSYDIWGDAVNIAARMEQSSDPGKINISGSTFNLVKDENLTFNYRGQIPIKNKGKIDMYFVNAI